ncbi:MAG: RHS repeat-associated core domain-containing protein, partial [Proteobacteria bacterium]|nr:RHS repeat-associated core domain-containing protein [Pseudomonadota bacterium]
MTLTYDTNFPHRVTQTSWGELSEDYSYDDNGNLTTRSSSDPGRANLSNIAYTRFHKPASLDVQIGNESFSEQFIYDAEDQLVHKQGDPAGETLYFDDLYYEEQAGGETSAHFVLHNGSRAVAELVYKQNAQSLAVVALHDDHLGSVVASNDSDTSSDAQRREFAPFGGFRVDQNASDPNRPKTRLGYTGHEHFNKLGLVNMKGRIYDAHMGRFLQPDPFVPEPGNSQSWNRYSYVVNNPLNWTDPTGFSHHCEDTPMAPECQTTTDSSQPAPVSCPPGYYAAPFFPGADPCQPIPPCPDGTVPIASPEGSRGGQWCNPVPSSTGRNPREILPIGRPGGSDVLDPTMDVGPGSTGGGGGSVRTAEVAVDLTPAGDIVTLVDPDAPDWAKVMAGISLALGPLPVGGLSRILAGATR